MSQNFTTNTPPSTTSGSAFATQTDERSDALLTMHSGAARPSYAKEGTFWLKNDDDPLEVYFYDGSTDVLIAQVTSGGDLTFALGASQSPLDEDDFASDSETQAPSQQSTKAFIESRVPGISQKWENMLPSRTFNTVYVNNGPKPLEVVISGVSATGQNIQVSHNGTDWVSLGSEGRVVNSTNYAWGCQFKVPPGHSYRVNGTTNLFIWAELIDV